jgi:hypothetical protein
MPGMHISMHRMPTLTLSTSMTMTMTMTIMATTIITIAAAD